MILRTALLLAAVASLIALPKTSTAGFVIFTNETAFNSAKAGVLLPNVNASNNFDSVATGNKTNSFALGTITFNGTTELSPGSPGSPVPLDLAVVADTTASAPNFLGVNGGFGDFQGGASPSFGDKVTLTIPSNSRAIGLNIITDTIPDALSFGRLTVGATNADTLAGSGTLLTGSFRSYFVGILGQLPSDTFSSASVSFMGGGSFYRVDNIATFTAVPEPTSLALVGIAGLASLVRRRVRSA